VIILGGCLLVVAAWLGRRWWVKRQTQLLGTEGAPTNVRLVEPEVGVGVHRSRRQRGSDPGDAGAEKPGGPISNLVRRSVWALRGAIYNNRRPLWDLLGTTGVVVFVGPNGSGKSLAAVESVLGEIGLPWSCDDVDHVHNKAVRDHVAGCGVCVRAPGREVWCLDAQALLQVHGAGVRLVYSTVAILDPATGMEHQHYRPLDSIRILPVIEHAVVLLDEVEEAAGSDQSATMPGAMRRWMKQLRKRDVFLRVTTPGYDACAKPIRSVCRVVVDCRSFYEVPTSAGRRWRPRLAMCFEAYDAWDFGTFDKTSGKRLRPLARNFYWRGANRAQSAYNSLAQVHSLSEVDDRGACWLCNGSRTPSKCGCSPEVYDVHPADLVIEEVSGERGGKVRRAVRRSTGPEPVGPPEGVPAPVVVDVDDAPDLPPADPARVARLVDVAVG
jgi:hypothetical protein